MPRYNLDADENFRKISVKGKLSKGGLLIAQQGAFVAL
jgi:hypothetical protein